MQKTLLSDVITKSSFYLKMKLKFIFNIEDCKWLRDSRQTGVGELRSNDFQWVCSVSEWRILAGEKRLITEGR